MWNWRSYEGLVNVLSVMGMTWYLSIRFSPVNDEEWNFTSQSYRIFRILNFTNVRDSELSLAH